MRFIVHLMASANRMPLAAIVAASLMMAGCQTIRVSDLNPFGGSSSEPQPCPAAATLADAVTITEFGRGTERDESNVIYTATIERTVFNCEVVSGQVRGQVGVAGTLTLGRKGQAGSISLPMFIALTRDGTQVISKRFEAIDFDVERGATTARFEKLISDYTFNLGGGESTTAYQILTGFNLTPDQVEYNRRRAGG